MLNKKERKALLALKKQLTELQKIQTPSLLEPTTWNSTTTLEQDTLRNSLKDHANNLVRKADQFIKEIDELITDTDQPSKESKTKLLKDIEEYLAKLLVPDMQQSKNNPNSNKIKLELDVKTKINELKKSKLLNKKHELKIYKKHLKSIQKTKRMSNKILRSVSKTKKIFSSEVKQSKGMLHLFKRKSKPSSDPLIVSEPTFNKSASQEQKHAFEEQKHAFEQQTATATDKKLKK